MFVVLVLEIFGTLEKRVSIFKKKTIRQTNNQKAYVRTGENDTKTFMWTKAVC